MSPVVRPPTRTPIQAEHEARMNRTARPVMGEQEFLGNAQVEGGVKAPDMVAHPPHYTSSPAKCHNCGTSIECYWITEHLPFSLGSAVKYIWRRMHKGSALEDLKKARQYITFEIEKLEREARG